MKISFWTLVGFSCLFFALSVEVPGYAARSDQLNNRNSKSNSLVDGRIGGRGSGRESNNENRPNYRTTRDSSEATRSISRDIKRVNKIQRQIKEVQGEIKKLNAQIKKSRNNPVDFDSLNDEYRSRILKAEVLNNQVNILTDLITINGHLYGALPKDLSLLPVFKCIGSGYFLVEQGSVNGDGSEEKPFGSIGEALEYAEMLNLCQLHIFVDDGLYVEGDLNIPCNTTIQGTGKDNVIIQGSLLNAGPNSLFVAYLKITGTNLFGAIAANHPDASTILFDVIVENSSCFGVRQHGGSLEGHFVEVSQTISSPNKLEHGTGIYLSGGVDATFYNIWVNENEAAGLVAEDDNTHVMIYGLTAYNNHTNQYFWDIITERDPSPWKWGNGFAAIEARNDAKLLIDGFDVSGNEGNGVYIHHGSHAHLRNGKVDHTSKVPVEPSDISPVTGNNFFIMQAIVELNDFSSTYAEYIGLFILPVSYFSLNTTSANTIQYNSIGFSYTAAPDESWNYLGCIHETWTMDNGQNFIVSDMPVISAEDLVEALEGGELYVVYGYGEDEAACPIVPWE